MRIFYAVICGHVNFADKFFKALRLELAAPNVRACKQMQTADTSLVAKENEMCFCAIDQIQF